MPTRELNVQRMIESSLLPDDEELKLWMNSALMDYHKDAEVLVRIVDSKEITALNQQYRHKLGATNILSFPFELPDGVQGIHLLGDLVVCADVLEHEAKEQQKNLKDHWAHIIIHGILHLIGYDHIDHRDAMDMESKEIHILQQLGIDNPYQEKEVNG